MHLYNIEIPYPGPLSMQVHILASANIFHIQRALYLIGIFPCVLPIFASSIKHKRINLYIVIIIEMTGKVQESNYRKTLNG